MDMSGSTIWYLHFFIKHFLNDYECNLVSDIIYEPELSSYLGMDLASCFDTTVLRFFVSLMEISCEILLNFKGCKICCLLVLEYADV